MIKHFILSHWDLDGISSVINIWNFVKQESNLDEENFEYKLTTYNYMDKQIKNLHKCDADFIWITDLNFTEEQFAMLEGIKQPIIYIDHHQYSFNPEEVIQKYNLNVKKLIINDDHCGALNTFKHIESVVEGKNRNCLFNQNKSKLLKLNVITDLYDKWQKDHPKFLELALPLNDLYWNYGYEKFFLKFRNGYNLNEEDKEITNKINNERSTKIHDYFIEAITNSNIALYLFKPTSDYINEFTIFYPNFCFYLFLKTIEDDKLVYSLRINNSNDLTFQEVCVKMNLLKLDLVYGGHPKAGGITVETKDNEKFLEGINKIFEEMVKNA